MIRLDRMPMTPLRRRFIDDLLLRNYAVRTIETYVTGVVRVAKYFRRSPDLLGPDDIRTFQLELLKRKVSWCQFNQTVCALRFLYAVTLSRPEMVGSIPFGKRPKTLPVVMSPRKWCSSSTRPSRAVNARCSMWRTRAGHACRNCSVCK